MTYFQHAIFSSSLGISLLAASFKAFIHAIIPSLFITSSSDLVKSLDDKLKNAGCRI